LAPAPAAGAGGGRALLPAMLAAGAERAGGRAGLPERPGGGEPDLAPPRACRRWRRWWSRLGPPERRRESSWERAESTSVGAAPSVGAGATLPGIGVCFCPPGAPGACCVPHGRCIELIAPGCDQSHGIWFACQSCDDVQCPPAGACCLPSGCEISFEGRCHYDGGTYMGDGVPCNPDPCPAVPVGSSSWGRMKSVYR
jgi:hypothetical protein